MKIQSPITVGQREKPPQSSRDTHRKPPKSIPDTFPEPLLGFLCMSGFGGLRGDPR